MKHLVYRMILCCIIILGVFFLYDIYFITNKINEELLNKFELNIFLETQQDVSSILENIKKLENEKLQFKQIKFFSKEELFDEIRKEKEFLPVLDVIEKNPFSDCVKITFNKFSKDDFEKIINNVRNAKEIIFDENLKSYLLKINVFLDILYFLIILNIVFISLAIIFGIFIGLDRKYFVIKTFFILCLFCVFLNINIFLLEKFIATKFQVNWFCLTFFFLVFILCLVLFNRKYEI